MADGHCRAQQALQEVMDAFESWRRKRPQRSPIPEHLWRAAAELFPLHSTHRIARALRLDYAKLKQRIEELSPGEVQSGFIEFKGVSLLGEPPCSIVLRSPEGFQMVIRTDGASSSHILPLIGAFLGRDR